MRRAKLVGLMALSTAAAIAAVGIAVAGSGNGRCQGEHILHEARTFLMEQPRRFGPRVAELDYGAVIQVLGRAEGSSGWCRVEHEGATGFVHLQSFTPGTVLAAGQAEGRGSVDHGTVQLAARGFNPEIEERNRKENPELDYDLVDALEVVLPDPEKIVRFASEGSLWLEASQ